MIITRTPFRISFFGGGTDHPEWFYKHGGSVLTTTIDKYCYITCRYLPPFFEHKHRVVYSVVETVNNNDEIEHPIVRAIFNWAKVKNGLEVHYDGDLPARSGMGSSSSFTVGLINALYGLAGKMVSKRTLSMDAIYVERDIVKENVGFQDQISAAFGGLNLVEFRQNGDFNVSPLIISPQRKQELHDHLMLCFTGCSRIASEIEKTKIDNIDNLQAQLTLLYTMVNDAIDILQDDNKPIEAFGELLDVSWKCKRGLSSNVSTPEIDLIYETAIGAGAIGGKILGAGGGGFLLLFARPEKHAEIRSRLNHLVHVPFNFENSGSSVVFYKPEFTRMFGKKPLSFINI
jgi:D-glycero-alpha-D-manno-heptose-7-phosphate kinase